MRNPSRREILRELDRLLPSFAMSPELREEIARTLPLRAQSDAEVAKKKMFERTRSNDSDED